MSPRTRASPCQKSKYHTFSVLQLDRPHPLSQRPLFPTSSSHFANSDSCPNTSPPPSPPQRLRHFNVEIVQFAPFPANPPTTSPTFVPSIICPAHKPLAYAKNPIRAKNPASLTSPPALRNPCANRLPLPPGGLNRRPPRQPHPTYLPNENRPAHRRLSRRPILPPPPGRRQFLRPG